MSNIPFSPPSKHWWGIEGSPQKKAKKTLNPLMENSPLYQRYSLRSCTTPELSGLRKTVLSRKVASLNKENVNQPKSPKEAKAPFKAPPSKSSSSKAPTSKAPSPKSLPKPTSQSELRKAIVSVQKDTSLTPRTKRSHIKTLMQSQQQQMQAQQPAPVKRPSSSKSARPKKRWSGERKCSHYTRGCKMSAPCCDSFYACRRCHDEQESHVLDRKAVDRVQCNECDTVGEPGSDKCSKCGHVFGVYHCATCNFYELDATKKFFHCAQCQGCKVGEAADFVHCSTCGTCVSALEPHKCVERALESSCPVCSEWLANSTQKVMLLPICGHPMHVSCYDSYKERYVGTGLIII